MSDHWTSLTKCPYSRFSNVVWLSSDEFIVAPYNYSKQKSDGIQKYSTTTNKWMTLIKYPKDFQISNCTLSLDENEGKLYLLGAESIFHVITLTDHKFDTLANGQLEVGVNPTSLCVEGTIHILGGSRNRKHITRNLYTDDGDDDNSSNDEKADEFVELFEFEDWAKGNQNCGVIHIKSRNQLLLLGGYNQYCEHQYSDMVWVYELEQDAKKSKKHKKDRKWVKKCKMPERACYFGYVLSSDERYIILMGGYTTGKKQVKKTYVLDVESMKFIKASNISSPASGSVRATMGEDNHIYLFKHDNGALWKIHVQKIISQYDANDDNYAYQLVKKYKKLLKAAEMENRQIKLQLSKQKQINEQMTSVKRRSKGKRSSADNTGSRKVEKKVQELEQLTQDQQTEIRRLEEKVAKQERYINDLESEKMMIKNTSLTQRMQIKEMKSRLGELEEDEAELNSIEAFLAKQAKKSKQQDAALEEVGIFD
eukprot:CAMPEP_0197042548 /NCGR_PEP_ID=MMETSP1384-20130603/18895_1 /TAXON_ID=29189 /ORGANISM="Ammonia sp." /LENGTH=480 /DNA_ID=CAMNT_0042473673 /DNA_START=38 /DNA_END=1480 /DNA_ORIENTATION=+